MNIQLAPRVLVSLMVLSHQPYVKSIFQLNVIAFAMSETIYYSILY